MSRRRISSRSTGSPREESGRGRSGRIGSVSGLIAAVALLLFMAGCGGGAAAPSSATVVVPPTIELQGCTYEVSSTIPPGEPTGLNPGFASFEPDASADRALEQIKAHGGTAMVDGVTVPSGIALYSGPDASLPSVGTVAPGDSILVAEPVVYTDQSGGTWLAFFMACGGQNLYWMSVDQAKRHHHTFADQVSAQIAQLREAAPYTQTGSASMLPILINADRQLAFADSKVSFDVGRGELYDSLG